MEGSRNKNFGIQRHLGSYHYVAIYVGLHSYLFPAFHLLYVRSVAMKLMSPLVDHPISGWYCDKKAVGCLRLPIRESDYTTGTEHAPLLKIGVIRL